MPGAVALPHNDGVSALPRRRPLIWIALFAWLAQLCLPAAHAAVMAGQDAGLAVWCGKNAPVLQAQLANLPDEVREILQKGSAQAEQHADCLSFCAQLGDAERPATPASAALHAAGLEPALRDVLPAPRAGPSPTPPVRGPPRLS